MSQLSSAGVRVIDPVLSTFAQGYADPEFVGDTLFPAVPVSLAGGQIIEFGKEAFKLYATARAPGVSFKRIQFGYLGRPYALENHGLEVLVPMEHIRDAKQSPGIDLSKRAMRLNMQANKRVLENAQATLALNASAYGSNFKVALTGTSKWSDPAAKPITQITSYKEAVRTATGRYPNVALMSAVAWAAFQNNPEVQDRIKYTQTGVVTEELAARLLGFDKVVVGKSVKSAEDGTFSDIWGNNCVLAYTALGSLGAEEPSYGYTYTMVGHPSVSVPYWENNANSWIHQLAYERAPVLSGITAGFLIQNPN